MPANIPDALDAGPNVHPAIQVFGQGTQNYTCVLVDAGTPVPAWSAAVPEANLYECDADGGALVGTHFGGPTWQWDFDGSTFVGDKPHGTSVASPDDPPTDVAWLLLPRKGGSDAGVMSTIVYAQRVSTVGGQVGNQDAGCDFAAADAGLVVKVPYSATYIFYESN
ncbi:MAG: DUF3455 domain-containing protein [Deltaproteobacteria bacterium]|nr:DUF3455 domain-containing protein [Deltaproteobacteria bacterium]